MSIDRFNPFLRNVGISSFLEGIYGHSFITSSWTLNLTKKGRIFFLILSVKPLPRFGTILNFVSVLPRDEIRSFVPTNVFNRAIGHEIPDFFETLKNYLEIRKFDELSNRWGIV